MIKVWDAGTGKELPGEAIPDTLANERICPNSGRHKNCYDESTFCCWSFSMWSSSSCSEAHSAKNKQNIS